MVRDSNRQRDNCIYWTFLSKIDVSGTGSASRPAPTEGLRQWLTLPEPNAAPHRDHRRLVASHWVRAVKTLSLRVLVRGRSATGCIQHVRPNWHASRPEPAHSVAYDSTKVIKEISLCFEIHSNSALQNCLLLFNNLMFSGIWLKNFGPKYTKERLKNILFTFGSLNLPCRTCLVL